MKCLYPQMECDEVAEFIIVGWPLCKAHALKATTVRPLDIFKPAEPLP